MCFSPLTIEHAREIYAQSSLKRQSEFVIFGAWQEARYYECGNCLSGRGLKDEIKKATVVYALEKYNDGGNTVKE